MKHTKGFVLQIQQGATHVKSHMQVAEEEQSGWLQVPRIAVWSFEAERARTYVGGGTLAEELMKTALKQAEEQWRNGVEAELQMCSERYEAVDGGEQAPTDASTAGPSAPFPTAPSTSARQEPRQGNRHLSQRQCLRRRVPRRQQARQGNLHLGRRRRLRRRVATRQEARQGNLHLCRRQLRVGFLRGWQRLR